MKKYSKPKNDIGDTLTNNLFTEETKKIGDKLDKLSRKEGFILKELKLKSFPVRINEDLDVFIDSIHKTLLEKGFVDDKYIEYKGIKKCDLFSKIINCSNNFKNPYFKWVLIYNMFRSKVIKYNYQHTFPTIEILKGKTQSRSFYIYENDIEIISNLSKKLHIYNITIGDLFMILVAEFIKNEECLSEYNELSENILSKWSQYESDLPKKFYDINKKIAEDLMKSYDYSSINIILKYIIEILDFTNDEIIKYENKEYINSFYLSFINDLYEKLKIAISKIDEKKEAIKIVTEGNFDVDILEYLKKKLKLNNELYNR